MVSCCKASTPSGSIKSRNFINRLLKNGCYTELIFFVFIIHTIFVKPSVHTRVFKPICKLVKSATSFAWNSILNILRKYVENIKVSLKCDWNDGHLTCRPIYICDNTSLTYSQNEKCFRHSCRQNKYIHFMFETFYEKSYCL